jgi:acetyl esterase
MRYHRNQQVQDKNRNQEIPMALHPQVVDLIRRAKEAGVRPTHELSPQEARAQMEQMSKIRDQDRTAVGAIEDRVIPGPAGDVPVRIYTPTGQSDGKLPALMFFHGGGHVVGSLDSHDLVARNLCMGGECVVVSVDYRMGPEHPFPAAPEDCFAATRWVCVNADELGIDPTRVAVSGDSAGGNLAAVVALMARDASGPELCFQLLVYPVADYAFDTASYSKWAEGAGILTAAGMKWFRDHYLARPEDGLDWRAAPLRAKNLSDLPPALVITAECDVLHDEGVLYAEALAAAGVAVEHRDYPGMMHGFFSFAPVIDDGAAAQAFAAERLRSIFQA